jgi:hypothetical protein
MLTELQVGQAVVQVLVALAVLAEPVQQAKDGQAE